MSGLLFSCYGLALMLLLLQCGQATSSTCNSASTTASGDTVPRVCIDAYPNTTTVEQGTTLILVCRVVGVPSTTVVSYQWTCPGGFCDAGAVEPEWAARIQQGNILVVNTIRAATDSGIYFCTVRTASTQQVVLTTSYAITVTGGLSLSSLRYNTAQTFFPRNSFITNATLADESRDNAAGTVHCYGGLPITFEVGWFRGNNSLTQCLPACVGSNCGSSCQANGAVQHDVSSPGLATIYVFTGDQDNHINQDLECRVTKFNGTSAFLGVYLRDGVSPTLQPPISITQGTISTTSVSVSWSQVSGATGYYVSYQRQDLGSPPVVTPQYERIVGGDTTSVTLSDLEPGTTYKIRVWSRDGTSVSSEARETDMTTMESAPSAPRMLTITGEPTESTIELNWLPPLHPNGAIHYEIEYEPAMTPGDTVNVVSSSASIPYFTLTLPNAFVTYNVRVVAVNSQGRTRSSALSVCLGMKGERAPRQPTTVTVGLVGPDTAVVSWDEQQNMMCDAVIENYSVMYQLRNVLDTSISTTVNTSHTSVTLKDLAPNTEYTVSVATIHSNGDISVFSDRAHFITNTGNKGSTEGIDVLVYVGISVGCFLGGVLLTAAIAGGVAIALLRKAKKELTIHKQESQPSLPYSTVYVDPQLQLEVNPAYVYGIAGSTSAIMKKVHDQREDPYEAYYL